MHRYPKWRGLYNQIKAEYEEFCSALDAKYQSMKDLEIMEFLKIVKDSPFKKPLCDFRGKSARNYKELFRDSPKNPITYLSSILKIYQKDKQIK